MLTTKAPLPTGKNTTPKPKQQGFKKPPAWTSPEERERQKKREREKHGKKQRYGKEEVDKFRALHPNTEKTDNMGVIRSLGTLNGKRSLQQMQSRRKRARDYFQLWEESEVGHHDKPKLSPGVSTEVRHQGSKNQTGPGVITEVRHQGTKNRTGPGVITDVRQQGETRTGPGISTDVRQQGETQTGPGLITGVRHQGETQTGPGISTDIRHQGETQTGPGISTDVRHQGETQTGPGLHKEDRYRSSFKDTTRVLEGIKQAQKWKPTARTEPVFRFEMTQEAADYNFKVLKQHKFDLQAIIKKDPASPLYPGSEWKPRSILEPIFRDHPLWETLDNHLKDGVRWPLRTITDQERIEDLKTTIEYGNHKSAEQASDEIFKSCEKEVTRGWQLPLPIDKLTEIPGAVVAPMGYPTQYTIDEEGNRIEKGRTTHDQSANIGHRHTNVKRSVNNRVITEELTPLQYGHTASRHMHRLVAMRAKYPHTRLCQSKLDYKSAYRRKHLHGETAVQCITTTKGITPKKTTPLALLSLRQTFGGSPGASIFCDISTPTTDLANALARFDDWDRKALRSSYDAYIKPPEYEPDDVPFAQARPLMVSPEADGKVTANNFIDDIIACWAAWTEDDNDHNMQALLVAFETVLRANIPEGEPLVRDDVMAIVKLIAEGTPTEVLVILGWIFDSRRLELRLPDDKYKDWINEIDNLISDKGKRPRKRDLETLLGRFEHAAAFMPMTTHFMNNLRSALWRCKTYGNTKITAEERADLRLWKAFLKEANQGIDMNLLTFRRPDHFSITDACTTGLGGFSASSGRGWRWHIPEELQNKRHINFLEFLACIVGILLEIFEGRTRHGDCHLSIGDNTSAMGWLRRSNFKPETHKDLAALARQFAEIIMTTHQCLYSQWMCGEDNKVADDCSRNTILSDLSDQQLTSQITSLHPDQVPETFEIYPLPAEIEHFILHWVQQGAPPKGFNEQLRAKQTATGQGGDITSTPSASKTMTTLTDGQKKSKNRSSVCLPKRPENARIQKQQEIEARYLRELATPPSEQWQRPLPIPGDKTPPSTKRARFACT